MTMLEILLPHARINTGHQKAVGTPLHDFGQKPILLVCLAVPKPAGQINISCAKLYPRLNMFTITNIKLQMEPLMSDTEECMYEYFLFLVYLSIEHKFEGFFFCS
jgi:hypothetical protein